MRVWNRDEGGGRLGEDQWQPGRRSESDGWGSGRNWMAGATTDSRDGGGPERIGSRNRTAGAAADGRDGDGRNWTAGSLNRTADDLNRTGGGGHAQRLNRTSHGRAPSRESADAADGEQHYDLAVCEWFRVVRLVSNQLTVCARGFNPETS
jgi:hypothetical protein